MTGSGDLLEFGGFRFDVRRMGVWKDDEPVALEPKALDVLHHLVVHRDRLVTKDELLDVVWKDTFVTPNALTRAVAQLRRTLGDDVDNPRLIETVAKRGYRFVAPVVVADGEKRPEGVDRRPEGLRHREGLLHGEGLRHIAAGVAAVAVLAVGIGLGVRAMSRTDRLLVPEVTPITSFGDVIDAIVAPDGKYVAYIRSSNGQQSLWIRQLKGTNAIELVAAAPVSYYGMAFAPDSSSIYYVVRGPEPLAYPTGMLFNVATLGGLPRRLGTPFDHHPAVSPDGQHLASLRADYPSAGQSALVVTDAAGAHARTLLVVNEPDLVAPGFFIAPSWSPAGDRIALAIRNKSSHTGHLAVVDAATGAVQHFDKAFTTATFTAWMPDGSAIVLVAGDTHNPSTEFASRVWVQPLPAGPPRQLTTGVVGYRNATITADGRSILSVGAINQASIWIAQGRDVAQKVPSMKEDGAGGVAWVDRDTIVFTSSDGGSLEIWTMKRDGSGRRQLTAGGWNAWPRPTRDGETIFFVTSGDTQQGIWRMRRDGTDPRLVSEVANASELVLTADERTLIFTAPGPNRMPSTWTVPVEGGTPALLVEGLARAAVSPDGSLIAGIATASATATPVLAIARAAGGEIVKTFAAPVTAGVNGWLWWSRDGASVLYTTNDRVNVWRQPVAGGPSSVLTAFADGSIVHGDLSVDGSLLVCRSSTLRDAFLITGFR